MVHEYGLRSERLEGAARIYPHHLDSGGLFLAKLRRVDGETGASDAADRRAPDSGWSPIPAAFPGDSWTDYESREQVVSALDVMDSRYGIGAGDREGWGWTMRGGRAWLHSAREWPLGAWDEGAWRPISVGIRALQFDSGGRPRPTNDFLRLVDPEVGRGFLDVRRIS